MYIHMYTNIGSSPPARRRGSSSRGSLRGATSVLHIYSLFIIFRYSYIYIYIYIYIFRYSDIHIYIYIYI